MSHAKFQVTEFSGFKGEYLLNIFMCGIPNNYSELHLVVSVQPFVLNNS